MFASRTVIEHLLRGVVGIAALVATIVTAGEYPLPALGLLVVALLALRGCPTCWTIGLIESLRGRSGRRCQDGSCAIGVGSNLRGNRRRAPVAKGH